jgi:hypothetical protein
MTRDVNVGLCRSRYDRLMYVTTFTSTPSRAHLLFLLVFLPHFSSSSLTSRLPPLPLSTPP